MTQQEAAQELSVLSPQELQALLFKCKGCTIEQTAEHLGVNFKRTEYLYQRVREKLGTNIFAACWLVGRAGLG